jgi:hypothetical protein
MHLNDTHFRLSGGISASPMPNRLAGGKGKREKSKEQREKGKGKERAGTGPALADNALAV